MSGGAAEQADDAVRRPSGASRNQSWPTVGRQRLSDLLKGMPAAKPRPRSRQRDALELSVGGEIGELYGEFPSPQVAWHLAAGRHTKFGEMPVALRPRGVFFVGEM